MFLEEVLDNKIYFNSIIGYNRRKQGHNVDIKFQFHFLWHLLLVDYGFGENSIYWTVLCHCISPIYLLGLEKNSPFASVTIFTLGGRKLLERDTAN